MSEKKIMRLDPKEHLRRYHAAHPADARRAARIEEERAKGGRFEPPRKPQAEGVGGGEKTEDQR